MKRKLNGLSRQYPTALSQQLKQTPRANLKSERGPARRADANARLSKWKSDQKSDAVNQRLQQELETQQIELEMQNTELQKAMDEFEVALKRYTDLYDFAPVGHDAKGSPAESLLHAKKKSRLELLGMRERVEMVRGNITVQFEPGKGTTILVQIPLAEARRGKGAVLEFA